MGEIIQSVKDPKRKLPIGIDSFEKLRTNGFYYVDKTGLLIDLLRNWSEVTLFTRPRRFGKSLNMSMLEAFFSPDSDKKIFDGLRILKEKELCGQYMGRYPVISISLKGLEGGSYETTYRQMVRLINREAGKVYRQVRNANTLLPEETERLTTLRQADMDESSLFDSLHTLSEVLARHYGQKVILLIDEYDVPLAKAYEAGYYEEMILLIRNLFQQALKTNEHLLFAVMTGCMRISKESIFTGLNNLKVLGVSDARSDEFFGFTDEEVQDLLAYYDLSDRYEVVREWYDGYRFGNVNVYCPWDVINYCDCARYDSRAFPENYWINSSSNSIVRRFLEYSGSAVLKNEMEILINGGSVEKVIHQELTYEDMYSSLDNLWSVLFTTGYLTQQERMDTRRFCLVIPNEEIRDIFTEQIMDLFVENVRKDGVTLSRFCDALQAGDTSEVENCLGDYLRRTISIRDTAVRKSLRENFYHGLLLGILGVREDWGVSSNQEAGDGYSDLIVRPDNYEVAMVIEVKYADAGDMSHVCRKALQQIDEKHYTADLYADGCDTILKYGIAFYRKKCRVMLSKESGSSDGGPDHICNNI